MNRHPGHSTLNDYVEGLLDAAGRLETEQHLEGCPECGREVELLGRLLAKLQMLPRDAEPGVDLRPGIRAEVARRAAPSRRAALHTLRWPLAAAALLLVAFSSFFTVLLVRARAADRAPIPSVASLAAIDPAFVALEAEYQNATAEITTALESARDRLAPETVRLLEANLLVVERALAESRAALQEDPGSPVIRALLLAAHRQKLDLLRRAVAIPAES